MSNQNLVPRTNGSGSLGVPTKRWGSGYFEDITVTNLSADSFEASVTSGSFEGDFSGSFEGDGALLDNVVHRDNFVVVQEKSDFPAPTGSVITLKDQTVYEINGTVNIGTDRIVYGTGSNIVGRNRPDTIRYEGTGSALTSHNNEIRFYIANIEAPSGSAFNFNGDGQNQFAAFHLAGFVDCKEIGNITDFTGVIAQFSRFAGGSTGSRAQNGITFGGQNMNHITFNDCVFQYFDDPAGMIELSDNLNTKGGIITSCVFLNGSSAHAIKVGENVSISNQFTVVANNFFHNQGTGLENVITGSAASGSVGVGHPDWLFKSNSGIRDSVANINYFIPDGATTVETTIPSSGTMVKLNANTEFNDSGQRFDHSNNRATYRGKRPTSVDVQATISLASNSNNQVYEIHLHKNGQLVDGSRTIIRTETAGQPYPGTVVGNVEVENGDYIEIFVQNNTSAANVTARAMSVLVRGD